MDIRYEVERRLRDHPLYSQEDTHEATIYCKLFDPYGGGTWYLTEYDGEDIAFGYVSGLFQDEWGNVSVKELASLRFRGIPRIECDLYFKPCQFADLKVPASA